MQNCTAATPVERAHGQGPERPGWRASFCRGHSRRQLASHVGPGNLVRVQSQLLLIIHQCMCTFIIMLH